MTIIQLQRSTFVTHSYDQTHMPFYVILFILLNVDIFFNFYTLSTLHLNKVRVFFVVVFCLLFLIFTVQVEPSDL